MPRLEHKRAIVTGGAVGIGRACVQRMAEEGAKVAFFDVLDTEGCERADRLTALGHTVLYRHVNVTDETAMQHAIDDVATSLGGLNVLVNNAGVSGAPTPTDKVTETEWDHVQAVNVKGVFFGTKHAIPHLRAAGVENHLRATAPDLEAAKIAAGAVHPVGHMGEPDDVAWGVVYLASDEAKFVTGTELVIDGGYTAH
jgi:NAD(P)-dependent dehydrogenase (short-subunit alcohol dehydrogenase family)